MLSRNFLWKNKKWLKKGFLQKKKVFIEKIVVKKFIKKEFIKIILSKKNCCQKSLYKKIINIHYQWSLPNPTPSATTCLKNNFQISNFDTEFTYNWILKKTKYKKFWYSVFAMRSGSVCLFSSLAVVRIRIRSEFKG